MTTLAGKRVLVVGASAGVGRAFATRAIEAGADVVLSARRSDRLAEIVEEAGGGRIAVGDVRADADCRRIVEESVAHLGAIDLVFHAVGYSPLRVLAETPPDEWRKVFETNVIGLQQIIAGAVPHLEPGGIVAVLSSEAVGRPRPGLGAYAASKAALGESLRGWRLEHPELRFSCIALGATQPTEFGDAFDMEVLGPMVSTWVRHGLMQQEFMETDDVAGLLVDLLGSALQFPGVGIEELVLRSPSDVIGPARP